MDAIEHGESMVQENKEEPPLSTTQRLLRLLVSSEAPNGAPVPPSTNPESRGSSEERRRFGIDIDWL